MRDKANPLTRESRAAGSLNFVKFTLVNEDWLECLLCNRLVFNRYRRVHEAICPKSLVGEEA